MKKYLILLLVLTIGIVAFAQLSSNNNSDYFLEVTLKDSASSLFLPQNENTHFSNNASLNTLFSQFQVSQYSQVYKNPKNIISIQDVLRIRASGNIDSLKRKLLEIGVFKTVEKKEVPKPTCSNPVSINDTWIAQNWANRDALDLVEAPCAWTITHGSPNISVGVVDTDIDENNPDLIGKISNIVGNNTPNGSNSHGTRSAGVICAQTNNNEGIASIGYDTKVAFYATDGWGVANSINQAYQAGIKIISVSWTGSVDATKAQEITEGGTLLVVAAGNQPWAQCHWDIANIPGVILVSGVGSDNQYSSTVGEPANVNVAANQYIDLCAPSNNVTTTEMYPNYYTGGWKTSIATPQVAAAALVLSVNSCLTPADIEEILKSTTDPIADAASYPGLLGTGRLNVYKAVLKASEWGNDLEVQNGTNMTLSSKMMYQNIRVKAGGTLHINNTTIYMGDMGKITVEAGGKLYINNSTISAHPQTINGCYVQPYNWKGIEVEGQPSLDQSPTSNQGYVNIHNNSVLKDARNCISTFATDANGNIIWSKSGGGIIIASNSTFTNNFKHVELTSYHRPPNATGVELNNMTRFTSCTFETDLTRQTGQGQSFQKMFTNWETKGVEINGCTFQNTNGDANMNIVGADHGTGIHIVDAAMKIQDKATLVPNYSSQPSHFYNLQIGVEDLPTMPNPNKGHVIKKNHFDNDVFGIKQTNSVSGKIYRNQFTMEYLSLIPSYTKSGYWGIGASGFQISENTFINNTQTDFKEIGATFSNSNLGNGGMFLINTHTNVRVGGQTEKQNQLLSYTCNTHTSEKLVGIALNPWAGSQPPPQKDPVSWLPDLGNCALNPVSTANIFGSNSGDIYNYTNSQKSYAATFVGNPNPEPSLCINMSIGACAVSTSDCSPIEPAEPNGWEQIDDKRHDYTVLKGVIQGGKILITDGGSQGLLDLIAQGANIPAYTLFGALDNASPYLSDDVLIAMLQTSQHLSEQQAVDILIANSALTQPVLNALIYRSFSPQALSDISTAQSNQSARAVLEVQIAQDEKQLNNLRIDLVNYYLAGSLYDTVYNYTDSMRLFLESENDELSLKQLIAIYIDNGQTDLAAQKLAMLSNDGTENANFIDLMNVLIDLKSEGLNVFQMSGEQENIVRGIATSETGTSYYAKAILGLVFGEYFVEHPVLAEEIQDEPPVEPTEGTKGTATSLNEPTASNNNLLKVFPNPATNNANVKYMLRSGMKDAQMLITNVTGAVIKSIDLNHMSGEESIDIQYLSAGIYFIELRNNSGLISVKKLIINK